MCDLFSLTLSGFLKTHCKVDQTTTSTSMQHISRILVCNIIVLLNHRISNTKPTEQKNEVPYFPLNPGCLIDPYFMVYEIIPT